jgi:hypothetical protein
MKSLSHAIFTAPIVLYLLKHPMLPVAVAGFGSGGTLSNLSN